LDGERLDPGGGVDADGGESRADRDGFGIRAVRVDRRGVRAAKRDVEARAGSGPAGDGERDLVVACGLAAHVLRERPRSGGGGLAAADAPPGARRPDTNRGEAPALHDVVVRCHKHLQHHGSPGPLANHSLVAVLSKVQMPRAFRVSAVKAPVLLAWIRVMDVCPRKSDIAVSPLLTIVTAEPMGNATELLSGIVVLPPVR